MKPTTTCYPILPAAFPNNTALSYHNATSKFIIEDTVPCNLNLSLLHSYYALVIGFPEEVGDPGLMWGNMGTLQQISALAVGAMWGFHFCSTERRLGMIYCSLD